ncbi:MAG TPA: hypothetical protein DDZ96_06765 [Porphyromonadaceae bacterium]|nr:hypothetical protein [Porphyromonadaceae bacterium]
MEDAEHGCDFGLRKLWQAASLFKDYPVEERAIAGRAVKALINGEEPYTDIMQKINQLVDDYLSMPDTDSEKKEPGKAK